METMTADEVRRLMWNQHNDDIRIIGEELISEADSRGWCDQYDKFIKRVNDRLHIALPERVKTFSVTQTYRVTRTVTVEARDASEAGDHELVNYAWDFDDLETQGDWTIDSVVHLDTEVEEA